jgi:G:T/U-mismatch repair DNA glycosylase
VFVGLNPGLQTAAQGHAYAHPSNHFWKLLFTSGCTTRRMHHTEDRSLPELYSFGITNIVARPSRNNAELTKTEMDQRVPILEAKVRKWKPESVTIVGKSIWESIWRARYGRNIRKHEFKYGWQDECENMGMMSDAQFDAIELDGGDRGGAPEVEVPGWKGAKVFVASTTSGAAAIPTPAEKQAIWRELGVWVEERRRERSRAVKKESVEVVEAGPASDDLPRRGSVTPCKCCIFSEGGCRWT